MDWKQIFDRVGLNGTRWQWRIARWQRNWNAALERARLRRPVISARHKFCDHCGALLERDDRECVRCGAKAPSYHVQAARRHLASLLPAHSAATFLLTALMVAVGLLQFFPSLHEALSRAAVWHARLVFGGGEWWRWVTYAFLHGGWMHLLFNAIALTQVGGLLEREVGSARFFTVYVATAVSAAGLFHWMGGASLVGASGSIFGLIGMGLAYAHFSGGAGGRELRNFFAQWAVYGMIFGWVATSGGMRIANSAHVGGLLLGLVLGWLIERDLRRPERWSRYWRLGSLLCLAATLSATGIAFWKMLASL